METSLKNILIVEDDVVFCKMLTRFLSKNGYIVYDAQSGAMASQIIKDTKIDLAILDYRLPDANGLEVFSAVKTRYPSVKSILITRFSDEALKKESDEAGIDGYIGKPLDPAELLKTIRSL
ncbi:two component, sigma54 specific, transcriptional regulator, Fis family [Lunatimonas lonarensis]|uniref:Two component, sigma54 specific, transcriptional regulator, Fis family n=1 Tax=Lunatimonas lonarensis TaxID=1232681 RepID=R7ZQL6_9BACT|nr:response regulator [Lunatimonas lonarensis]EON76416.1 two component, sigma54 specific, transcriptional regulator, Fis family [Lunatimonas lonarensis]